MEIRPEVPQNTKHGVSMWFSCFIPLVCALRNQSQNHTEILHTLDFTAAMTQAYLDAHQEMNEHTQSTSTMKLRRTINKNELLDKKLSQRLPL